MDSAPDDSHWIEVVDRQGLLPVKRLGPYASLRLAGRARRGVMRLLNAARYTVEVVPQQDLDPGLRSRDATTRAGC